MNVKKQSFLNFPLGKKNILLVLLVVIIMSTSVFAAKALQTTIDELFLFEKK